MTYEDKVLLDWINGVYGEVGINAPPWDSLEPGERVFVILGFKAGFDIAMFKERGP